MEKILLLILLSLVSIAGDAQYYPYDSNTTYTEITYFWHKEDKGHSSTTDCHLVYGNTYEKNGKRYSMVSGYTDGIGANQLPPLSQRDGFSDAIGIRMANGYIYVDREEYLHLLSESGWKVLGDQSYIPYRQTDDGELVLYDFNMQSGDRYPSVEGHDDISVTEISRLTTRDGVSRRLLTLSNGYKLLEGFGCINSTGMLFFYLNPNPEMKRFDGIFISSIFEFIGKYQNTTTLYKNEDLKQTVDVKESIVPANRCADFYDLQGRQISSKPLKGIYIQDGRKIVVR